ncbi:hypothetical protein ACH5RR_036298 [Cinchona calisaya]|uniref:Uncharacterized protein n=1 Tax=Cinchona calisaya TaxID=153742 RepID=A0ABD2Y6C7_9GENT
MGLQNEKALASEENSTCRATLKEAQKHCKILHGRVSRGHGCLKALVVLGVRREHRGVGILPNLGRQLNLYRGANKGKCKWRFLADQEMATAALHVLLIFDEVKPFLTSAVVGIVEDEDRDDD